MLKNFVVQRYYLILNQTHVKSFVVQWYYYLISNKSEFGFESPFQIKKKKNQIKYRTHIVFYNFLPLLES